MKSSVLLVIFTLLMPLSAFADLPFVTQNSWHMGQDSTQHYYFHDNIFLHQSQTSWLSYGRLSLAYPILFSPVYTQFSSSKCLTVADFTEDGFEDIVVASTIPYTPILLFVNPGNDNVILNEPIWPVLPITSAYSKCYSLSSADMDNDGDIDLLLGCFDASGIHWLENHGAPSTWKHHLVTDTPVNSIDVGDIDNDGDFDIVFCSSIKDSVGCMINVDGTSQNWEEETICSTFNSPFYTEMADINSDNVLDVVVAFRLENAVYWFERDVSNNSWTEHLVTSIAHANCLSTGDYNNDGRTDVLSCGLSENAVMIGLNQNESGTIWLNTNVGIPTTATTSCLLLDLANDGDLDIVVADKTGDTYYIISNTDGTGQNRFPTVLKHENPIALAPIDYNSDGFLEFAGLSKESLHLLSADPETFTHDNGVLTSMAGLLVCYTDDEWGNMRWESTEPVGTSISFQLRNSDDWNNMGDWSDTITVNNTYLGDIFPPEPDKYIQYRVSLNSDNPDTSPLLHTVVFEGYIGDIVNDSATLNSPDFFSVVSNPSVGSIRLLIKPVGQVVPHISVFDLSGRLVFNETVIHSQGDNQVIIEALSSGVYLINARVGDRVQTQRVCLI